MNWDVSFRKRNAEGRRWKVEVFIRGGCCARYEFFGHGHHTTKHFTNLFDNLPTSSAWSLEFIYSQSRAKSSQTWVSAVSPSALGEFTDEHFRILSLAEAFRDIGDNTSRRPKRDLVGQ
ncbi:MAG: hypothetical protein MZV64_59450 [Ignavibacteriales bacterium]|nr:hypothetical protein [Ignavibacteriales bacterium]